MPGLNYCPCIIQPAVGSSAGGTGGGQQSPRPFRGLPWGVHPTPGLIPITSPLGSHGAVDGSKGCGMERFSLGWFDQLLGRRWGTDDGLSRQWEEEGCSPVRAKRMTLERICALDRMGEERTLHLHVFNHMFDWKAHCPVQIIQIPSVLLLVLTCVLVPVQGWSCTG